MFTGIIETTATICQAEPNQSGSVLVVQNPWPDELLKLGASLAVNGCCLTVLQVSAETLHFKLGDATLKTTYLGKLPAGNSVNLERPLQLGQRLDGHWLTGHVDAVGEIVAIQPQAHATDFTIAFDSSMAAWVVQKGSIALDGISLTVNHVTATQCQVGLLPYSLQHTNFASKKRGDLVHIEFDLIGKYLVRQQQLVTSPLQLKREAVA